jgi:hypothetical protein
LLSKLWNLADDRLLERSQAVNFFGGCQILMHDFNQIICYIYSSYVCYVYVFSYGENQRLFSGTVFLEMFADTIFCVFHNVGIFAETNFRGNVVTANSANVKSLRPKLQFLEATFFMHDLACWVLLIFFFLDKSRLKRNVTRYIFIY